MFEYPQPLTLATEHLLLGLTAVTGEVGTWLAEQGLTATKLEAEVHRLAGHVPGPLPLDFEESSESHAAAADAHEAARRFPFELATPAESFTAAANPAHHPSNPTHVATGIFRVLDAAANRAGEGLRVVEDYLRFVLDDRHLTQHCKDLRHDLATVFARVPQAQRHAARDVPGDVGTDVTTSSEQHRATEHDVAAASCKRAQQALRSLEEFSKTIDPQTGQLFEQLRYRSYILEQAIDRTVSNLARLAEARLYVLVDGQDSTAALGRLAETLAKAGVDVLQLRDKALSDRILLERARTLAAAVEGTRTLFIMNDRPDLAVLAGAWRTRRPG